MARYRRNGDFTARASYGCAPRGAALLGAALSVPFCSNTYSALNAVAGHYNNFGTKYAFPAKRIDRVMKELSDAELLLARGR